MPAVHTVEHADRQHAASPTCRDLVDAAPALHASPPRWSLPLAAQRAMSADRRHAPGGDRRTAAQGHPAVSSPAPTARRRPFPRPERPGRPPIEGAVGAGDPGGRDGAAVPEVERLRVVDGAVGRRPDRVGGRMRAGRRESPSAAPSVTGRPLAAPVRGPAEDVDRAVDVERPDPGRDAARSDARRRPAQHRDPGPANGCRFRSCSRPRRPDRSPAPVTGGSAPTISNRDDRDRPGGQLDAVSAAHQVVRPPAVDLDRRHRARHLQQRPGQRGDPRRDVGVGDRVDRGRPTVPSASSVSVC